MSSLPSSSSLFSLTMLPVEPDAVSLIYLSSLSNAAIQEQQEWERAKKIEVISIQVIWAIMLSFSFFTDIPTRSGVSNSNWLVGHIPGKMLRAAVKWKKKLKRAASPKNKLNLVKIFNFVSFWDVRGPHKCIWRSACLRPLNYGKKACVCERERHINNKERQSVDVVVVNITNDHLPS